MRILRNTSLHTLAIAPLTAIGGDLEIGRTGADNHPTAFIQPLTHIDVLSELTTVGGSLGLADSIQTLAPLINLQSVGGDLNVSHTLALTSLDGLDNLTSIGGALEIIDNLALTDINGLSHVTAIGGRIRIGQLMQGGNPSLTNLDGLATFVAATGTIAGRLDITENDGLTSIAGLSGIHTIEGRLFLRSNDALISLSGLDGLGQVGGDTFVIIFNDQVPTCDAASLFSTITPFYGDVCIRDNEADSCADNSSGCSNENLI